MDNATMSKAAVATAILRTCASEFSHPSRHWFSSTHAASRPHPCTADLSCLWSLY